MFSARSTLSLGVTCLLLSLYPAAHGEIIDHAGIFAQAKPERVLSSDAGEGPAWHPKHGLVFSGPNGITNLKPGTDPELLLPNAGSNGLLFDRQGRLLVCQPRFRRFSRLNVETGMLEVLTDQFEGKKYNQPNDVTFDSKGRLYFSDPKYGSRDGLEQLDAKGRPVEGVYRVDLDGTVDRIIEHEVDRPNGLLVTPDDRYLFVADNNNNQVGAPRILWRFDLSAEGKIDSSSKKLIYNWRSGRGPDGMAVDHKGRLYVAGGRNQPNPPYETAGDYKGGIYVLSPTGKLLAFVPIPKDEVTNCTFAGDDLKTLYITAGGTLWKIATTTRGVVPALMK